MLYILHLKYDLSVSFKKNMPEGIFSVVKSEYLSHISQRPKLHAYFLSIYDIKY